MTDRPDRPVQLELALEQGNAIFEPGDRVSGMAAWSARAVPSAMELWLVWTTHGPGGRDFEIVQNLPFEGPLAVAERRAFSFTLPTAHYSFQGGLISLTWTLQLVAMPWQESVVVALTLAPDRRPIDLRPETPSAGVGDARDLNA